MKIALMGYGKMGHEIENAALKRGHQIVSIIDCHNQEDFESDNFKSADVAIEFSVPESAFSNIMQAFKYNIPVVAGTTGWLQHMDQIKKLCTVDNQTFFYSSNYSLGVNIFFAINKYLAKLMNAYQDYDVEMEETHHIHKLDAPSGTAITLAEDIISQLDWKQNWSLVKPSASDDIYINSIRRDEIPGNHKVIYKSNVDSICIEHDAISREGFAIGAVIAAEFIKGKKGFFTMQDLLNL